MWKQDVCTLPGEGQLGGRIPASIELQHLGTSSLNTSVQGVYRPGSSGQVYTESWDEDSWSNQEISTLPQG